MPQPCPCPLGSHLIKASSEYHKTPYTSPFAHLHPLVDGLVTGTPTGASFPSPTGSTSSLAAEDYFGGAPQEGGDVDSKYVAHVSACILLHEGDSGMQSIDDMMRRKTCNLREA